MEKAAIFAAGLNSSINPPTMSDTRILAFSSSRTGNSAYLETAAPVIGEFLGLSNLNIAFIPFASVDNQYDEYGAMVKKGLQQLPYNIEVAYGENARDLIEKSEVIMIGGGNTFKLLHHLYRYQLLDVIREKVKAGTPYIGWSAGSNIAGATIGTTNDMPIIEPKSFKAFRFFPFQINPHYLNQKLEGHNGETRDQRLTEFAIINPGVPIVCLPEGTALQMKNGIVRFTGSVPGFVITSGNSRDVAKHEILPEADLSYLL